MAGIRSTQYPGRWNVPDSNSPQGSAKNRTSPTSNDGSYLDEVWFNDMDSLHQALFIASGIAPNGTQDVGTASQIFDALVNNRWSAIGNYSIGTIVTASDGNQYYCNKTNGRDSTTSNPVGDNTDSWRQYPKKVTKTNDYLVIEHFDGLVEMSFVGDPSDSSGVSSCQFPMGITLEDLNYRPMLTEASSSASPNLVGLFGVVLDSRGQNGFNAICADTDGMAKVGETPNVYISYRKL